MFICEIDSLFVWQFICGSQRWWRLGGNENRNPGRSCSPPPLTWPECQFREGALYLRLCALYPCSCTELHVTYKDISFQIIPILGNITWPKRRTSKSGHGSFSCPFPIFVQFPKVKNYGSLLFSKIVKVFLMQLFSSTSAVQWQCSVVCSRTGVCTSSIMVIVTQQSAHQGGIYFYHHPHYRRISRKTKYLSFFWGEGRNLSWCLFQPSF